jgi:hypothetical protein
MYEAVLGRTFDQTNFGRRVTELDIIEAIDRVSEAAKATMARTVMRGQAGRRPQVWRLKQKKRQCFDRRFPATGGRVPQLSIAACHVSNIAATSGLPRTRNSAAIDPVVVEFRSRRAPEPFTSLRGPWRAT